MAGESWGHGFGRRRPPADSAVALVGVLRGVDSAVVAAGGLRGSGCRWSPQAGAAADGGLQEAGSGQTAGQI